MDIKLRDSLQEAKDTLADLEDFRKESSSIRMQ